MSGRKVTNVPTYAQNMVRACLLHESIPQELQSEWYDWSYDKIRKVSGDARNSKFITLSVTFAGSMRVVQARCYLDYDAAAERGGWYGNCWIEYQLPGSKTQKHSFMCTFDDNLRMQVQSY